MRIIFFTRRGRGRSGIMLAVIDMRGAEEKSKMISGIKE